MAEVLTRVVIQVGQIALDDQKKVQAWITFAAEAQSGQGKVFSGWYGLDRAKTNAQRRADLRALAEAEVPSQFDGGAAPGGSFIVEYLGI